METYTLSNETSFVELGRIKPVKSKLVEALPDNRTVSRAIAARVGVIDEDRVVSEFIPLFAEALEQFGENTWPATERGELPPLVVLDCEDPDGYWLADGNHRFLGLLGGLLQTAKGIPADKRTDFAYAYNKFTNAKVPCMIATCKSEYAKVAFEELSGLFNTNTTKPLTPKEKQALAQRLFKAYTEAKLYPNLSAMKERIAHIVGLASTRALENPEYLGELLKQRREKIEEDFIRTCQKDYSIGVKPNVEYLAMRYDVSDKTVREWLSKHKDVIEGRKTLAQYREELAVQKAQARAEAAATTSAARRVGRGASKDVSTSDKLVALLNRALDKYQAFEEAFNAFARLHADEETTPADRAAFLAVANGSLQALTTTLQAMVTRVNNMRARRRAVTSS